MVLDLYKIKFVNKCENENVFLYVVGVIHVTALSTQLQVTDRPVTQQGLGGPKTAGMRGNV